MSSKGLARAFVVVGVGLVLAGVGLLLAGELTAGVFVIVICAYSTVQIIAELRRSR